MVETATGAAIQLARLWKSHTDEGHRLNELAEYERFQGRYHRTQMHSRDAETNRAQAETIREVARLLEMEVQLQDAIELVQRGLA